MKKYRAVLFDYDGTLVDTNQIIINSWQHMANVAGNGMKFRVEDLIPTFGKPLEDAIAEQAEKYGITGYSTEELTECYRQYQRNHQDELGDLFPGIRELLKELKKRGYLVGIVTSRTLDTTRSGLARYDVLEYFDDMVGEEDTDIHKPNPEPCLICCKKLGVKPSEAIMVGDSRHDIACANNAGAASVFVRWSFCTKEEELEGVSKPTYVISSADQLLYVLEQ